MCVGGGGNHLTCVTLRNAIHKMVCVYLLCHTGSAESLSHHVSLLSCTFQTLMERKSELKKKEKNMIV